MEEHPIQGLMNTAMSNIKDMIDVNTIIGNPIQNANGTLIIPVSKVSFGFGSGGTEFNPKEKCDKKISIEKSGNKELSGKENYPFGGGSGAAVSINPIGFVIMQNENVKFLPVEHNSSWDKIFDYFPDVINKVNNLVDKKMNQKQKNKAEENKTNNGKVTYKARYDNQGNTVSENIEIEDE